MRNEPKTDPGKTPADHAAAKDFADALLRYPAPLDRARVENLARAYADLSIPSTVKSEDNG